MTDTNDLLKAIESIKRDMATKSDLETVKKDLQDVKQSQAQTNTALEALASGQQEIREKMATKADVHRLEQKIDKVAKDVKSHASRIENVEEHTGIPNPHKN